VTPLAVIYDVGAASPAEIALGLAPLGGAMFLTPPSEHNRRLAPVLKALGPVVPLDDVTAAARLLAADMPAGIITFSERSLEITAELAGALGLRFHTPHTVRLLTDKVLQRAQLAEAGLDHARSAVLRNAADWPAAVAHVGVPAVVKPVRGEGSRDTYLVTDKDAGARLADGLLADVPDARPFVAEEYLHGRSSAPFGELVSVESMCTPSAITHVAITGKFPLVPPFRFPGQFWPCHLPRSEQDEIRDLAGAALRALGVTYGITHTEIKLTPAGPRIIEVNGRLGGYLNDLSVRARGRSLVEAAGRLALGQDVPADQGEPGRVYFQYWNTAPLDPCRIVGIQGIDGLKAIEGIASYHVQVRVGDVMPGGVANREMDMICGQADDHASMFGILEEALHRLSFTLEFTDGRRALDAASLHL
jgi:hypothetical protein